MDGSMAAAGQLSAIRHTKNSDINKWGHKAYWISDYYPEKGVKEAQVIRKRLRALETTALNSMGNDRKICDFLHKGYYKCKPED